MNQKEIVEVTDECMIIYSDNSMELCIHAPPIQFADCIPGYQAYVFCPKWEFRHKIIDADQDQRDQLTTRLEMRRDE